MKIQQIVSWAESFACRAPFDTQARDEITKTQKLLLTTCKSLETTWRNVNQRVLDVLTAYLILHYSLLKETTHSIQRSSAWKVAFTMLIASLMTYWVCPRTSLQSKLLRVESPTQQKNNSKAATQTTTHATRLKREK